MSKLKKAPAVTTLSEVIADILKNHQKMAPKGSTGTEPQIDLDRLIAWLTLRRYQLKVEAVEKDRIKSREEIMELYPGRKYYCQFFKSEYSAKQWQKDNGGALYRNTPNSKSKADYILNADLAQLSPEMRIEKPFVVAWNG